MTISAHIAKPQTANAWIDATITAITTFRTVSVIPIAKSVIMNPMTVYACLNANIAIQR